MKLITRRLPLVTTIAIAVQMILGGLVVGKNAGFVCPDWPLCQGQLLPPLSGLVVLELVHRLSALVVGALVIATAVQVWRRQRGDRVMVGMALGAVASLLLQIVVGGLIVVLRLPGAATTIDVANSMVLLGLCVALTVLGGHRERRAAGEAPAPDEQLHRLAVPAWAVLGASFVAVVAGAVFRHTGASEALFGRMTYLASHGQHTPPTLASSYGMLIVHFMSAAVVTVAVLWFLLAAMTSRRYVGAAMLELVVAIVQMGLGLWALGSKLALPAVTLHWGYAAVLVSVTTWVATTAQLAHRQRARAGQGVRVRVTSPRPGDVVV